MKKLYLPSFNQLKDTLKKMTLAVHPSKFHGLICGSLCFAPTELKWDRSDEGKDEPWLQWPGWPVLQVLYSETHAQLEAFSFEFQLLLPNDRHSLTYRVKALILWCQGFLEGLHWIESESLSLPVKENQPNELLEALDDLNQIANMPKVRMVSSEENEAAYTEIMEYARLATVFVYQSKGASICKTAMHSAKTQNVRSTAVFQNAKHRF